jgi:hypothetical protein
VTKLRNITTYYASDFFSLKSVIPDQINTNGARITSIKMNRNPKNENGLYGFDKRLTKTKATTKMVNASEL